MTPLLRKLLLLLLGLILVAGLPPLGASPVSAAPQELDWRSCGAFQCATLSVPLDYEHPEGRQIELSVVRQRARNNDERIGSLFVNPGGPGGSAVDFLRAWAPTLSSEIRDRFDIITFDPRGVGESTPLVCHDNLHDLIALPPDPLDDQQWQDVFDAEKSFADLCAERSDGMLPYVGTVSVAKDIDQLRQALGEDKISYFGYSYGTELGAVYADLFPDRVRAMVLDGAVDLAISGDQMDLEQALGFETAYDHFLQDCRLRACLNTADDPDAAIQALLKRAEDAPIPAPRSDRPASEGELLLAVVGSMYNQGSWSSLARGVQQAIDGDATSMLRLADNYLGRNSDGTYDNSTEMNAAVNCLDHVFTTDTEAVQQLAVEFEAQARHFGTALAQGGLACAYWHASPEPPPIPRAAGAPPIVVIGTTSDPATPYRWAVAVSHELESGVLLTRHGEGHTAYRSGDSCIDTAVNDYLVSVEPPAAGSQCGSDRFEPPPLAHPTLPALGAAPSAPAPAPTAEPPPPAPTSTPAPGSVNIARLGAAIAGVISLAGGTLWLLRRS